MESIPPESCDKVGIVEVPPRAFVDDVAITNKDPEAARSNGMRMSKAVETVALECNPSKSAVLVIGRDTQKTRNVREDMTTNPMMLHNKKVDVKEKEPYLGFIMHQDGVRASINSTIKARTDRAWGKVANIKNIINMQNIQE